MRSLPLHKAGVGSAVNDTTRELGGALGVAVHGQPGGVAVPHVDPERGERTPGEGDALTRRRVAVGRRGGWRARRCASPTPPRCRGSTRSRPRCGWPRSSSWSRRGSWRGCCARRRRRRPTPWSRPRTRRTSGRARRQGSRRDRRGRVMHDAAVSSRVRRVEELDLVEVLQALGDPIRLQIVRHPRPGRQPDRMSRDGTAGRASRPAATTSRCCAKPASSPRRSTARASTTRSAATTSRLASPVCSTACCTRARRARGAVQRRIAATSTPPTATAAASVIQICARRRRSISSRRSRSKRSHRSLNRAIQGSAGSDVLGRQLVDHASVSPIDAHLPPPAQQSATGIGAGTEFRPCGLPAEPAQHRKLTTPRRAATGCRGRSGPGARGRGRRGW